jgi:molybdate transport system ATP-binding protein
MIIFDCQLTHGSFIFDAAFETAAGITAIVGPSGSGKSTLLNLMAGLSRPVGGRIQLGDQNLCDVQKGIFLKPHLRRTGLVFQDGNLFPHLTVRQNLGFGHYFAKSTGRDDAVAKIANDLGIVPLLDRRPRNLSGGERQRVALGRALLSDPRVLLLDEPLASLDMARKLEVMTLIETIRDTTDIPMLYVTHAHDEVRRLASHVITLSEGKVVASGTAV